MLVLALGLCDKKVKTALLTHRNWFHQTYHHSHRPGHTASLAECIVLF